MGNIFGNGLGLSTSLQFHTDKSVKSHISQKSLSHKTNKSYETLKLKTKTLTLWFFGSVSPSLALCSLLFLFVVLLLRRRFILHRLTYCSVSLWLSIFYSSSAFVMLLLLSHTTHRWLTTRCYFETFSPY